MGSQISNLETTEHKIISELKDEYYERIVNKYSSLLDNYMLAYKECRKHWMDNRSDNERLSADQSMCQRRLLQQCDKLTKYYDYKVSKLPINILKINGIDHPPFCLDLSKDLESMALHTHNPIKIYYIGADQNNSILQINNNDLIILGLSENPTTGYSWDLKTSSGLNITETSFSPTDISGKLVGSGGIRKWSIRAISKGEQIISGTYRRPWEDTEEHNFNYNVTVNVI